MWLADVLLRNRIRYPDGVALRDIRREVTWSALHREVSALAAELSSRVSPGGRVLLLSGNRVEMLEAYLGCAAAGVIAAPVNPALTAPEVADIIAALTPALVLADPAGRARLLAEHPGLAVLAIEDIPALPPGVAPPGADQLTAPVAVMQTSATTGRPKGVAVDQRGLQVKALSFLGEVSCGPGTVFLDACPLFHGSVVQALNYLAAASTVCMLDGFTPRACLTALRDWRVKHMLAVPSMIALMLRSADLKTAEFPELDLIMHGAAPMPADLADAARAAFSADLMTVFGITEGGGPTLALRPGDRPAGPPVPGAACVGLPMLGVSCRITRDDGTAADAGEIGEIWVAGDGLMQGYWQDPEATAEVMRDGWLNTRDLGCADAHGYVWVVDRRNDLILRGGQNVYPAEIEETLRQAPWVADVAVVPATSTTWGQTPVAFVLPATPGAYAESDLLELCVTRLASYKRPSRFVAVERMPRSVAGKLLRSRLREDAELLMAQGERR